jgi:hypothetical protein
LANDLLRVIGIDGYSTPVTFYHFKPRTGPCQRETDGPVVLTASVQDIRRVRPLADESHLGDIDPLVLGGKTAQGPARRGNEYAAIRAYPHDGSVMSSVGVGGKGKGVSIRMNSASNPGGVVGDIVGCVGIRSLPRGRNGHVVGGIKRENVAACAAGDSALEE